MEPSDPRPPGSPLPGLLKRAQDLAADEVWLSRLLGAALLALVAVAASFLLTPSIYSQSIPWSENDLGRPAVGVIKAQRDYNIPDEETTLKKREDARAGVRAVYDFDAVAAEEARRRVADAFTLMRESGVRVDKNAKVNEADMQAARDEFVRNLQVVADEPVFLELARARFAPEVQGELEHLISRVLRDWLVAERGLLAAERDRGITVREMSAGAPIGERTVRSIGEIKDLGDARDELAQVAGGLPKDWNPQLKHALLDLGRRMLRPTLTYNKNETDRRKKEAGDLVRHVVIQLKKGEKIIGDGEKIEKRHLTVFRGMRAETRSDDLLQVRLGGALFAALLVFALFHFGRRNVRKFKPARKDLMLLASVLVAMLALSRVSMAVADVLAGHIAIPREAYDYAIPFAAAAMMIRLVLHSEAALLFAVCLALLVGQAATSMQIGVYAMVGSLVAADAVAHAKDRGGLFRAGLWSGLAQAATVACFALFASRLWTTDTAVSMAAAFVGGALFAPILVMGVTPLVEMTFGYTTDIKLLELANLNHPVLKELIVQAPGTYHHSIVIGSLVEAAAHTIHANPLLARVGAYYHDIGKSKNPLYFGENQKGENRHDKLAPSMSALVIKRHVQEGMELARAAKLPKPIVDFIPQHHGTRLIGYFWHKAREQASAEGTPLNESDYRYAGPKPQSREAALVMIADAVEASAKSLADPTPDRLQGLVQKVVNTVFADGQLDECELTLKDLNAIAGSFYSTLLGIYHTRPEYPASASAVKEQRGPRIEAVPKPLLDAAPAQDIPIRDGGDQQPPVPGAPRPALAEGAEPAEEEKPVEGLKRLGMH